MTRARPARFLVPAAAMMAAASPAAAAGWNCSNRDIAEIRCAQSGCEIERESYTPIEVSVAPGRISICAYSGCFDGRVALRRTASAHHLYQAQVPLAGRNELASIVIDRRDGSALMRWAGFSNVMRCTRS